MGIIFEYHFRIYIEIWIISNSVYTEIKRFPENMLALENLAPSQNLAPPAPLRVQAPLISPPSPIFCASAFYSPFCEYIKCAYSIQISYIYFCPYQIVTEKIIIIMDINNTLVKQGNTTRTLENRRHMWPWDFLDFRMDTSWLICLNLRNIKKWNQATIP